MAEAEALESDIAFGGCGGFVENQKRGGGLVFKWEFRRSIFFWMKGCDLAMI